MRGLAAVATVIAIAVAGCAIGPGPTAPATVASGPTAPGAVASGPDLGPGATIQDVAGDVVDLQDRPGATPAYIDVRRLSAASDGSRLQLTLTLAEALPAPGPGATERLAFNLHVYAADPAIPENANDRDNLRYTIAVNSGSMDDGLPATYHPGIFDWTRGPDPIFIRGPDFPGTLAVEGDTIVLIVSLAALGDPGEVWIGAQTVSTLSTPEGEALSSTGDSIPDAGQDWLVLEP